MVNYIFSDKTGTLTKNIMEFKRFSAGFKSYGNDKGKAKEYEKGVTNVNFRDDDFWREWEDEESPNFSYLQRVCYNLAICHAIIVEEKDGILHYNASSPDELALTNAARHFGLVFEERDEVGNIVVLNKRTGNREKFELLDVIEFSSARKRMSVVIRTSEDKIICMTKGADSIIISRLRSG
jgi:magnesium-transporting ATPase (P-type)